jgi:regulator of sigma E protease
MKENLAGPLGILTLTFQRAREGWEAFLWFIAFLNIALMILNILPIPILDGGHILITTIESLAGRPVPVRMLAGIYYVFFVLLISLVIMVTWFDVLRFATWFGLDRLF